MPPGPSCSHSCFSTLFYRKNSTKWGLRVRTRVSRHLLSKKLDQIENYSKRSIGFEDVPKRIEFYEQTLLDFYQPSAANPWILDRGFEGVLGHAQNRLPGSISLKELDQLDELVEKTRADAPRRVPRRSDSKSCQNLKRSIKKNNKEKLKIKNCVFRAYGYSRRREEVASKKLARRDHSVEKLQPTGRAGRKNRIGWITYSKKLD